MKKVINNEQVFLESKTLREGMVDKVDIIDKVKSIAYLSSDLVVNVEMVSDFYEVSKKSINTIIERNRDELEEDGIMVLKGQELKDFKSNICHPQSDDTKKRGCLQSEENPNKDVIANYSKISTSPSMTILTRRAMLRIGMLLTGSSVAIKVRNYLLNCEENSTDEQRRWAIQREVGKIDRKRMGTAINKFIPESKNKRFAYPNYTNMIYRILFNKDAVEIRAEKGLEKKSELTRDHFNECELTLIDEAETITTALLMLGFTYDYIKQQLEDRYRALKLNK